MKPLIPIKPIATRLFPTLLPVYSWVLIFLLNLLSLSQVMAHDFWLEAQPFYSKAGDKVDIGIYVGEDMFGEALPNIPDNYTDFSYTVKNTEGKSREKISGELARYPAGYFQSSHPGYYTVGYQSKENGIRLSANKFNDYLKEEGLEKILKYRQQNNQADKDVSELYSRHVKTIVSVSPSDQTANNSEKNVLSQVDFSQQIFGYTIEITPLTNPYKIKVGDELAVKIEYLGKPAKDLFVSAYTKETPWERFSVRSDAQGLATFKINRSGHWIIRAVEMVESKRPSIDWESFWASLTFKVN